MATRFPVCQIDEGRRQWFVPGPGGWHGGHPRPLVLDPFLRIRHRTLPRFVKLQQNRVKAWRWGSIFVDASTDKYDKQHAKHYRSCTPFHCALLGILQAILSWQAARQLHKIANCLPKQKSIQDDNVTSYYWPCQQVYAPFCLILDKTYQQTWFGNQFHLLAKLMWADDEEETFRHRPEWTWTS